MSSAFFAPPLEFAYDVFASHATDPDGALVRRVEAVLELFDRRRGLLPKYSRELQLCVDGRDFVFPRRQGNSIVAIEPIVRAHQKKSRSLLVFSGSISLDIPGLITKSSVGPRSGPMVPSISR